MRYTKYPAETVLQALEMRRARVSIRTISDELGVPRVTISRWGRGTSRLAIVGPALPTTRIYAFRHEMTPQDLAIVEQRRAGAMYKTIAVELGVPLWTVYARCRRAGLVRRRGGQR